MRVPALYLLLFMMTAAWILFLAMTYLIFSLIIPISPPIGSPYSVVLEFAILKLLLSGIVFLAWLLSYYLMRDLFIRYKGLEQ